MTVESYFPPRHPLLVELEERAAADGVSVISSETGRFLATIVTAMQANRILEVGTSYGAATLWMALAQPSVGRIWTIDPDAAKTAVARLFFERAAEDDYIEVFNTPPFELLENFPQRNLDIAFVSADTRDYDRYLELILPMLKLSGLAIFDHCLARPDFTERFLAHPALVATLLPLDLGIAARRQ